MGKKIVMPSKEEEEKELDDIVSEKKDAVTVRGRCRRICII